MSEVPLFRLLATHQQPDMNYIQVLEKVDFPCTVNAQHLPFKGNRSAAGVVCIRRDASHMFLPCVLPTLTIGPVRDSHNFYIGTTNIGTA